LGAFFPYRQKQDRIKGKVERVIIFICS